MTKKELHIFLDIPLSSYVKSDTVASTFDYIKQLAAHFGCDCVESCFNCDVINASV